MKAIVIAATLIAAQAFAYNTTYNPIQFGAYTEVDTNTKALAHSKLISLVVDLNSTTGHQPLVQISTQDQRNCSHKQTLILFSGYDLVSKTYKRTYEIQIERDPSQACYLAVLGSTDSANRAKAARVMILPSK